jgi:hypothetical protein
LPIPAIRIAAGLLPLTVLTLPAIGTPPGLLPLMRLTIPAVSKGTRLIKVESLTILLRGKGTLLGLDKGLTILLRDKVTTLPGLGSQGAQGHKQTHRENNAPPSSRSHLTVLLNKILHSRFVCNLVGRPREKVK